MRSWVEWESGGCWARRGGEERLEEAVERVLRLQLCVSDWRPRRRSTLSPSGPMLTHKQTFSINVNVDIRFAYNVCSTDEPGVLEAPTALEIAAASPTHLQDVVYDSVRLTECVGMPDLLVSCSGCVVDCSCDDFKSPRRIRSRLAAAC
ncbi:hypothetical protein M378DRAFT_170805 [Amanita muscaria Koide BX008]|uniref:Uncharacterized protein n=1 Tax=Amanita muscaria (strain Koide BX008) TaxID=946122 RepID=A0A0C2WAJ7_AMAMK|nr:hypothetical protein M378DRAFT_170805 [Amanita muscaria Koide BX008]